MVLYLIRAPRNSGQRRPGNVHFWREGGVSCVRLLVLSAFFFIFGIDAHCWVQHTVMSGSTARRSTHVLVGEFMGTSWPNGNPDIVASFYGLDVNGREDGSFQAAYDYSFNGGVFTFSNEMIEGPVTAAAGMATGDLDGDGDQDIIGVSRADEPDGYIAWWYWDDSSAYWQLGDTIDDELDQPTNVAIGDIDGDEDFDVVATIYGPGTSYTGSLLAWYENVDGDGTNWTRHDIDTITNPYAVEVGYLNLDGILDIVCTSTNLVSLDEEGVYIYYGLGSSPWFNSTPDEDFNIGSLKSPRSVRIADFDYDDINDLVVAFTGHHQPDYDYNIIMIFGEADTYPDVNWVDARSLNPNFATCRDVYPVDLDNDGDFDLAASSLWGQEIYAFYCPDSPDDPREDDWDEDDVGSCEVAKGLAVGEFTGDDYPEIVASSFKWDAIQSTGYVYLYENELGGDSFESESLTVSCASTAILNNTLSYSYSYTLDEESEVELYAWYKVVTPGFDIIAQSPVDTLGTEEDTYTGGGTVSIPDSMFSVGDRCQFFFGVGHTVSISETDPPEEILFGDETEMAWFEVVSQNEIEGNGSADAYSVALPSVYSIESIQPNPFNPTTTITVALPEAARLSVQIYNLSGQRVANLANGYYCAGRHAFIFDGSECSSGLYFVRANVADRLDEVRKLTLLK